MKPRDRVIIAILAPIAVVMIVVAIVYYKGYAERMRERDDSERYESQVDRRMPGNQTGPRHTGPNTPDKKDTVFYVVPENAAEKMGDVQRREIFDEILAILKTAPPANETSDDYYRRAIADEFLDEWKEDFPGAENVNNAYYSLLNFRQKAVDEILDWIETEPEVRYYALKACVALKSEHGIDAANPHKRFIAAALATLPTADAAEKRQIAMLLGCYREDAAHRALRGMLADDAPGVRRCAIAALGRVGGASDVLLLAIMLDDEDVATRTAVCDALDALLNYNAGTDLQLPGNYNLDLDARVAQWRKWLADNHDSLAG